MKEAIQTFHQLEQSIQKNSKDLCLLSKLQKALSNIQPQSIDAQVYSRLMISIYDLSNHHNLITYSKTENPLDKLGYSQKPIIHNLGIKMKLLSLRMICILLHLIMNGYTMGRLDRELQIQVLQIMIISIRICLDSDSDCLAQVYQYFNYCCQIYDRGFGDFQLKSSSHSYKQLINQDVADQDYQLTASIHMIYYLNKFDILRSTLSEHSIQSLRFEESLQQYSRFVSHLQTNRQIPKQAFQKFKQYVQNITVQITLKLLRQGSTQCFQRLSQSSNKYLPANFINTITKLMEGKLPSVSELQLPIGEVYQLYWYICTNGIDSVHIESLQKFISRQDIFKGQQIFQVILLLNQPMLLDIWFNQANKKMQKLNNITLAYQCFISLIVGFINKDKIKQALNCKKQIDTQKWKNRNCYMGAKSEHENKKSIQDLVRVCKQVMLNLIREKKDSNVKVALILLYITKFMLYLVVNLYNYQTCSQLFINLELVGSKHPLPNQFHKTITSLHLYYELLNNKYNREVYQKFIKYNGSDTNQNTKILKDCYQILGGPQKVRPSSNQEKASLLQSIARRPQYFILFCQPKQQAMLLLQLDLQKLCSIQDIFLIFLYILQDNFQNSANLYKVSAKLQKLFLTVEFSKLSISRDSCVKLKNLFLKKILKDRQQIKEDQTILYCLLFLYVKCFNLQFDLIQNQHYGIVMNKYSKILKMIDLVNLDAQIVCVLKVLICKSCQKFKKQVLNYTTSNGNKQRNPSMKCNPQAGQIIFIKMIYNKIEQYSSKVSSTNAKNSGLHFIQYSLFELYCLNNRSEQIQQMIDTQDLQLYQLYINSEFIPKKYKLILLRKLFKTDLTNSRGTNMSFITFKDIKELILLAESPQESYIYISAAIKMFGEKGKKFIQLLAAQNQKVADVFLHISTQN